MIYRVLADRYFIALGLPSILLLIGALSKKLIRGQGWRLHDFFLGVEFALVTLSMALLHLIELGGKLSKSPAPVLHEKFVATAMFLLFTFFIMLIILVIHQEGEGQMVTKIERIILLALLSNLIGFSLLAIFTFGIKGIQ